MTQGLDGGMSIVRRWQLAAALKLHREQAGFSQEQAIDRLNKLPGNWSRPKLSRIENREHNLKPREVEQLLDVYGVTDADTRDDLVRLTADSGERGWWDSFGKPLTDNLRTLVSLESGLIALRDFQNQLINGLLQTSDYTRALALSGNSTPLSAAELERGVARRMARQQIIAKDPPPQLHFILDEAILRRLVGDRIVMHDQMRKLLQATEKPSITIQVLPFDVGGGPGLTGPFTILTLPAPMPDIGYSEGRAGTFFIEDRDRVRDWVLRFGMLIQQALSREESAELITDAMKSYEWPRPKEVT